MIPFGPWHPDGAGINTNVLRIARNCLPSVQGFRPLKSPVASSDALASECFGAATVLQEDGGGASFAGTATGLFKLLNDSTWSDFTRTTGGDYATATGERWRFAVFGDLLLATNFTDDVQKLNLVSGTAFEALGGSPPKARYVDLVRDFVVLGGIYQNEKRLQWSSINDAEGWTAGTNQSDYQDFPAGGPIRGLIGGEVGYVFQSDAVTRMIYVPGSDFIFQFDEIEGGRGLAAPSSLVRLAREAFYFAGDGFYRFSLGGGASQPIGVGKWAKWFLDDLRTGTELAILSGLSPDNRVILWPYISKNNTTSIPDRVLIYDWALDEADFAELSVEALSGWLTGGVTLDTMNSYGNMETLLYSLDSPFWKGGVNLLGVFGLDHKLSHLEGTNMEAFFETSDGRTATRNVIVGTRPQIDAEDIKVAVATREKDGDAIAYEVKESLEDTGVVPAWASGNLIRARVTVPADQSWTFAKGLETVEKQAGTR